MEVAATQHWCEVLDFLMGICVKHDGVLVRIEKFEVFAELLDAIAVKSIFLVQIPLQCQIL